MAANDRQVGGNHYKTGGEEHWDRVQRLGLDYFQGQITKYVERWKLKNGVEDLKKARHFLDKYIELTEQAIREVAEEAMYNARISVPVVDKDDDPDSRAQWMPLNVNTVETLGEFEKTHPRYLSDEQFRCEGGYGSGDNLYTCLKCRVLVRFGSLAQARQEHRCTSMATQPPPRATPGV